MSGAPIVTKAPDRGPKSGILIMRNGVADYFAAKNVPATVGLVGLKYRSFVSNQGPRGANRVVFIPGEFDGNPQPKVRKYGAISRQGRNSGSAFNPPEIASWERPVTISVWAGPLPGQSADEGQNLEQAENLLELVIRALNSVANPEGKSIAASLHFGEVQINAPPVDNAFGAELLFSLVQIAPFYGEAYEYVQPNIVDAKKFT